MGACHCYPKPLYNGLNMVTLENSTGCGVTCNSEITNLVSGEHLKDWKVVTGVIYH